MRTDFRRKFDSERFNAPFSFVQKGVSVSESRQNSSGHEERRQAPLIWLCWAAPSGFPMELQVLPSVTRLSNHVIRVLGQVNSPCAGHNIAQSSAS